MATPEIPRDDLVKMLRRMQQEIDQLKTGSPFAGTGMSVPGPGVVQVDGDLNISGATTVSGSGGIHSSNYVAGTAGWNFNASQLETHTSILGFSNGGTVAASASNFGLTTTFATGCSGSVVVPAGYTRCGVIFLGQLFIAVNPNTTGGSNGLGGDALYAQAIFNGIATATFPVGISGSNGFATANAIGSYPFDSLTAGSVLTFSLSVASAYQSIAANAGNQCFATFGLSWAP